MKIAVFLAPGFEEIEALTVVDYLRRAKQEVITVSVPEDGSSIVSNVVTGSHKIPVTTDTILKNFIDDMKGEEPDGIYFPGGMPGASNLAANQYLFQLATKMARKGKIVAAMCAAPAVVLAQTGILADKKWTCYPDMEKQLDKWCGSKLKAEELTENSHHIQNVPFVLDDNILTGRGPGTAEQFAMKLVEMAAGAEVAEQIKKGSCQR